MLGGLRLCGVVRRGGLAAEGFEGVDGLPVLRRCPSSSWEVKLEELEELELGGGGAAVRLWLGFLDRRLVLRLDL